MLFIKNGYVKPMVGQDLENGCILVDGGKIVAVGAELSAPEGATIIDAGGGRGMQSMDNSIQKQLDAGLISAEEAYMKASDKNRFLKRMEEEEAEKAAAAAAEAAAAAGTAAQ